MLRQSISLLNCLNDLQEGLEELSAKTAYVSNLVRVLFNSLPKYLVFFINFTLK